MTCPKFYLTERHVLCRNSPSFHLRVCSQATLSPVTPERLGGLRPGGHMRVSRFFLATLLILASSVDLSSQQTNTAAPQDAQAISVLKQSLTTMGTIVPADSTATGSVTITAGSDIEQGSITIQTRGSTQTLEQLATTSGTKKLVYSNGLANDTDHAGTKTLYSAELAATGQSALFPLPFLAAILSSADSAYQYVGLENVAGTDCHHIRIWRTFSSQANADYLAPFSIRDIWIDSSTNLPNKLAYSVRAASGAEPSTSVEIAYSKFQLTGGVQYPFGISKSINGTPWVTISISSVSFNTGLADSNFSLQIGVI